MTTSNVRLPAVAGTFYPEDPVVLRDMVRGFLREAVPCQGGPPLAMVAPHAGYIYSGYTAACGYRCLEKSQPDQPRRVFVLSPSHRVRQEGISVGNYSAYRTPLGDVSVDQEAIRYLLSQPDVTDNPAAHKMEHALEVHLPFLQETVVNFRLVPIVFGEISGGHLADLISGCWRPGDLLVGSSDLSHFYPYDKARQLDARCHDAILSGKPKAMESCEACGNTGISALLEMARRQHWRAVLVDYRNSGDTAGDKARVVGYASYLFYPKNEGNKGVESGHVQPVAGKNGAAGGNALSEPTLDLPALVRTHLAGVLAGKKGLNAAELMRQHTDLQASGACFITLTKAGRLRGCIGSLEASRSLAVDLLENSVAAAIRDPRFRPLRACDLGEIRVEVSLLSAAEPLLYEDSADLLKKLQPGVHGVILEKSGRRATFLPQVWEQISDAELFLDQLCRKAGLAGDCWQQKPTISVYTVKKTVEKI